VRPVASIVLSLALLAGCGDSSPPPVSAVTVTLGTIDASGSGFYNLSGDQPLVAGAQGGFHVWLKYRVAGMPPATVRVSRTVRRVSDGRLVLKTEGSQEIGAAGADGAWELPAALPSFMCPSPVGVRVEGEAMRFQVVLSDPDTGEVLGTGEAVATPQCPPPGDGQHDHCMQICVG
jgi:hypothetical protein